MPMYCSNCGATVGAGLSYCNHCGARLVRNDNEPKQIRPETLVFAILATFVFGLIAITILMGMMKTVLGLPVDRVLAFALVPFLLMVLLEIVFVRLLVHRRGSGDSISDVSKISNQHATNELAQAPARVLTEGWPSVTEHTTRMFDQAENERRSK